MIVLNEAEWAKRTLEMQDKGDHIVETLSRIAKYYYSEGMKNAKIKEKLIEFLCTVLPNAPSRSVIEVKWDKILDRVVKNCARYPIVMIDSVPITKKEMAVVDSLSGVQLKRLAFTLLSMAKYYNIVNKDNNDWVPKAGNNVTRLANLNVRYDRQGQLYHALKEKELIRFSVQVDSLSVQVTFIDKETDTSVDENVAMRIRRYENLGNQYMMFHGAPYMVCSECGLVVPKKSNAQKYCKECAANVRMRKSIKGIMEMKKDDGKSRVS